VRLENYTSTHKYTQPGIKDKTLTLNETPDSLNKKVILNQADKTLQSGVLAIYQTGLLIYYFIVATRDHSR
jgi:hypothetical protein